MGVDDNKDSNAQYKYYYFLSLYIEVISTDLFVISKSANTNQIFCE